MKIINFYKKWSDRTDSILVVIFTRWWLDDSSYAMQKAYEWFIYGEQPILPLLVDKIMTSSEKKVLAARLYWPIKFYLIGVIMSVWLLAVYVTIWAGLWVGVRGITLETAFLSCFGVAGVITSTHSMWVLFYLWGRKKGSADYNRIIISTISWEELLGGWELLRILYTLLLFPWHLLMVWALRPSNQSWQDWLLTFTDGRVQGLRPLERRLDPDRILFDIASMGRVFIGLIVLFVLSWLFEIWLIVLWILWITFIVLLGEWMFSS